MVTDCANGYGSNMLRQGFFFLDYEWWLDEEGSGCLVDGNLEDEFSMVCWNEKHNKEFFFFFFFFLQDGLVGSNTKCCELG